MTQSAINELLGTDSPIIQAPMAGVQGVALAAAVSNAGALGSLPCAMLGAEALGREIAALARATSRPFNLNFFCHQPPPPDTARVSAWRDRLAKYYEEFEIDPASAPAGASRQPFDHAVADVVEAFRPQVVSFHFGLPVPELVARVRSWGSVILSSATTVAEARWLEANGADAVIVQGAEAGGHRGMFLTTDVNTQVGTFALLPAVRRAIRVPVIAAGGIADRDGVSAARVLGADAVQIGTAYLLCPEATTSSVHRAALQDPASVTAITNVFTGRPARGIVNRAIRELGPMSDEVPAFPLAASPLTALRREAERRGSGDFSPLWAGQNLTGCKGIPAGELTKELAAGFGDR